MRMAVYNVGWDLQDFLPKNFSYENSYHRNFFYPKVVYERIRQRSLLQSGRKSSGSLASNLSSCSSLPDLPEALLNVPDAECVSDLSRSSQHRSESNENLNNLERSRAARRVPFTLGESLDQDSTVSVDNKLYEDGCQWQLSDRDSDSIASTAASSSASISAAAADEQELLNIVLPPMRRRSSSLRRTRSPSGQHDTDAVHQHKKTVRFADAMGLDLRAVKHFTQKEKPPVLPSAALNDLRRGLEEAHKGEGTRYVCACFKQPDQASDFLQRVLKQGVSLERCIVGEYDSSITGTIRVANICYHKTVTVRYTINKWVTFDDVIASYVLGSNDGTSDRFCFSISLPKSITVGNRLELAVRFDAIDTNCTYWDNNYEDNYCFECYARSVPVRESDFAWLHFL